MMSNRPSHPWLKFHSQMLTSRRGTAVFARTEHVVVLTNLRGSRGCFVETKFSAEKTSLMSSSRLQLACEQADDQRACEEAHLALDHTQIIQVDFQWTRMTSS